MGRGWWPALLFVFPSLNAQHSEVCAPCHPKIAQTYAKTGMARSFYRPTHENSVEDFSKKNTYYHQASDTYFQMIERGGRYFQRQFQIGFDGKETNSLEKEVDFVMGSGNHVRTYLHRTAGNTLVQLPLAWYSEKGGYWAMNPGYDRPDHPGFRRAVTYDCMFCHNGYPAIPAVNVKPRSAPVFTSVPEGIDCERCHGSGEKHVALARSAARRDDIRKAIVNPSRLTSDRQMEICMQCHLQTTSSPLPASIVRYERGPFSYRPGEPLADFMLHFDRAPETGRFEITGSVYRLRQSQCFLKSDGRLNCTTCHDPHGSARDYAAVCRQCHGGSFSALVKTRKHTASADCTGCHMPKRRTEDVVHAVMTDHLIQRRRPEGNLLADRREADAKSYRGPVAAYYPKSTDEFYLAIAQVAQSANLSNGIAQLSAAIEKYQPAASEYYLQLGDALSNAGKFGEALSVYEEALRREPESVAALERLAICLSSLKQYARAEGLFKRVLEIKPEAASIWIQLGLVKLQQGNAPDAIAGFEQAIQADPDMAEAYNSIGGVWLESGDLPRAETALRNAIRIQPNYAQAHNNLGDLLSSAGRFEEARSHFEAALRYKENYNGARYNYALALTKVHRLSEAQSQVEAILRTDTESAEGHEFLGNLLNARGQVAGAIAQYREAIRIAPEFSRANLDLGALLVKSGDTPAALKYLRKASESQEAEIRDEARKILGKLE